ncbi:SufE family protein [Synechococcus sp. PCC 7336]|uniref:SufE family protein n=1 Tax=Synechococcus sp. PCC 7336 TaxID=195250 RepID=UPI00034CFE6C|nr:SufE family protein [Synechococcus sp. PCC 7336]
MSANSLPPALEKLVKRFARATSNKKRYEQLLWLANQLEEQPASAKVPENKVSGCVSNVYIAASLEEGKLRFSGDSDSQLTKGLVAFLIRGLDGLTPAEIAPIEPDFIQDTGLQVSLTPSRANGFINIFKTMQQKAAELLSSSPAA